MNFLIDKPKPHKDICWSKPTLEVTLCARFRTQQACDYLQNVFLKTSQPFSVLKRFDGIDLKQ